MPEGAVIIREHTPLNNLFSCLWFNEVNQFTPRDQLSFGYVVYRLGESFKFFMFPNCEYNSLFILHRHTREHSSVVEWVKSLDEFKTNATGLKESRGGLGLWTPYPGDLDSVQLPPVQRTSQAGWGNNLMTFFSFLLYKILSISCGIFCSLTAIWKKEGKKVLKDDTVISITYIVILKSPYKCCTRASIAVCKEWGSSDYFYPLV